MKAISCTIWILGVLLVVASLDALPDPPAVNPSVSMSSFLQLHDCACETAILRCDSLVAPAAFPGRWLAADTGEPYRPSDRIVLAGQAADSSPPFSQTGAS